MWGKFYMKSIINRLCRLENASAPAERERTAVEAILERRRRRLGDDYKPTEYPPGWFDNCRDIGERTIRARQRHMTRSANEAKSELLA